LTFNLGPDERLGWRALGLLRIVTALIFLAHGTMKFFGWPPPPAELNAMLEPGTLMWWSGVLESLFGPLLLVGLLTRPVAFLASGEMAIGYFVIHAPANVWPAINEGDAAILYTFVFLLFAAAGPGAWSLDSIIWRKRKMSG
jgi:putative oxidoreductase